MKVGDMVRLSEYGIARDYNSRITMKCAYQTGIVVKVHENASYPYKVRWMKTSDGAYGTPAHSRRELKYAYR